MDTPAAAAAAAPPTTSFIFRHAHTLWRHTELRLTLFDGPDADATGAPCLVHLITHRDDYDQLYYSHHEWTAWCQARMGVLEILYVHYSHTDTDHHIHWTRVNDTQDTMLRSYLRRFFEMPVENAFDADLERLSPAVYAASAPCHYGAGSAAAIHDIFPTRYEPVRGEPHLYYATEGPAETATHILCGSFDRLLDRADFFEQERAYYEADIVHAADIVSTADALHSTLYARTDYAPPAPDSWQAVIYEFFCRGVWRSTGFHDSAAATRALAATTVQRAWLFRYRRRCIAAASWALTPLLPRVLRREILLAAIRGT